MIKNSEKEAIIFKNSKDLIIAIILLLIMYLIARSNYLLFHVLAEGFAIIVAIMIYVIATRTFKYSQDNFLQFLGIAYLFIAVLDFFHVVTYKGMGIFHSYTSDVPTQLWIAGRYLEALSLFLAPLYIMRKISKTLIFSIYALLTGTLLYLIMILHFFPACLSASGLTPFKIISEYVISFLVLLGIPNIYFNYEKHKRVKHTVLGAMIFTILSELSFTLYVDVYGIMNFVGHFFKIISYYFVYIGIILGGLETPYDTIFNKLQASATLDHLTGLYNRRGFMELAETFLAQVERKNKEFGFLVMDINNFKLLNDRYGHLAGDEALKRLANILQSSVRKTDIVCRLGGDEFVVLVDGDKTSLNNIQQRIRDSVREWIATDELAHDIGLSIGASFWRAGNPISIDSLITEADREMYKEKAASRQLNILNSIEL